MWVFVSARLRQWVILAVVLPLLTVLIRVLRQAIERRSGQTRVTRALGVLENAGQRRKKD